MHLKLNTCFSVLLNRHKLKHILKRFPEWVLNLHRILTNQGQTDWSIWEVNTILHIILFTGRRKVNQQLSIKFMHIYFESAFIYSQRYQFNREVKHLLKVKHMLKFHWFQGSLNTCWSDLLYCGQSFGLLKPYRSEALGFSLHFSARLPGTLPAVCECLMICVFFNSAIIIFIRAFKTKNHYPSLSDYSYSFEICNVISYPVHWFSAIMKDRPI